MLSPVTVVFVTGGWLVSAAGMFAIALSHVRRGASWRVLVDESQVSNWTKGDEERARKVRKAGRGVLLAGTLLVVLGYGLAR